MPEADSVHLDLDMDSLRAEPSPAGDVSLVADAGPVRVTFSLTSDAAIGLANQLTDAVDLLDGRSQ